ncbi:hypothetical protein H2202_006174 [Exophiala xenobiotica]|nr:hypothetical protein H2202_006174 [Exophiala xenobiotica]KAK5190745.1 hypothetical protein LTR92_009398 [Exophiala xenobiotica]KAK5217945.1 hypothetical protein LTR72_009116 [Exophiala xenobiotica]KAK5257648.1 hypothetical protein LTR40_009480 [Exophiala xenobiotica]KAK5288634.1 hypothetical protein LTR14_007984 [Exophiala xenobiotica]
MPMTWNADADAKLFAAVLATSAVKVEYEVVAQLMGPDCTKKAITHRISSIKAKAKDLGLTDAVSTTPLAKTPTKRGRKVKAEPNVDDNDASDDESPTKKSKATPTKAKPKPKAKAKAPIKAEPINETKTTVKSENESDDDSDN